jgi:hypothetical protein
MNIESIVQKTSGVYSTIDTNKAPTNHNDYYAQLVDRNQHFISHETQEKLSSLKISVGGCGTVGGACLEPLARLGVENFKLADNGTYELTNLNRQCAYVSNIGENKATYNLKLLKQVNPFIKAKAFPEGVTPDNVEELVDWADLIVDAVDVTSKESISMKIALHERAKLAKKPVFSAMDPGFCNCGLGYDYRKKKAQVLDGRLAAAISTDHPFKAWFYILPVSLIPTHCLPLIVELLQGKTATGSQLVIAANLLSAIIASCVVRFVDEGVVIRKWNVNLEYLAMSFRKRFFLKLHRPFLLYKINRLLSALP